MDTGLEQTKIYEAHYPENLRRIFVINGTMTIEFSIKKELFVWNFSEM